VWACENLEADCLETVIYKNGEKLNDVPHEKGRQQLIVYYKNKKVGVLNQYKKTEVQSHAYSINVSNIVDAILIKGEVIGPESSAFQSTIDPFNV